MKELAALKGVSMTSAVTIAVDGELERLKSIQGLNGAARKKSRSELLMEFAKEYTARVKDPIHSWEIDALLYDEDGLLK